MKKKIEKALKSAIKDLQLDKKLPVADFNVLIERPKLEAYGDYTTNVAMAIAEKTKMNPMAAAGLICDKLKRKKSIFEDVKAVQPGFINFFLSKKALLKEINRVLGRGDDYGKSNIGKGKTIIIDYSSVNIAKPFSVGHLRSTIIGQTIYNLYKHLGYKTIGDNHIGDWGTQFGKLLYAIKKWGREKEISRSPVKILMKLYVKFHQEAEKNPEIEDEARNWFKKLERGDKEALLLWRKCVRWSLKEFERTYKLLGIKIDLVLGESFYQKMAEDVIKEALKAGVAKESQGAVIISFPGDLLPPLLIRKSDGTTLYSSRDLAAIKYRRKRFKPVKIVYEVGAEQILYFKQLFWAAELLGWGKREDYVHIAHGMMRLPTGKMSTRKGKVILLDDLLSEAIERAKKIALEKNPNIQKKQLERISRIIGIGAVKYNNLSRRPLTDIVFKWDEALNLEGNSGPYIQYSYVRAKSILKNVKKTKTTLEGLDLSEKEIRLFKNLIKFPEIVKTAAESYKPNLICDYLFKMSQGFNSFYEEFPVLAEKDKEKKTARII
ncbi:MAG TPA: arginine--tRNA ligase, partial [Candidatus Parcubacteria bacterium]|nr:arginine--tRNA ligase [Candidatus Parcubacteria bacterium]